MEPEYEKVAIYATRVAVPNPVGPAALVPVTTMRYTRPLPTTEIRIIIVP